MKKVILILAVGLLSQLSALSQTAVDFNIDFGTNTPPHSPGVPTSGAILTNGSFFAAVYLDSTAPISGSIKELNGGTFTTVLDFTNLVFAGYPGGGVAYDYEGSWQLNETQLANLMAGQWYAEVTYNDASYMGQISPAPEPSSLALFSGGLVILTLLYGRRTTT